MPGYCPLLDDTGHFCVGSFVTLEASTIVNFCILVWTGDSPVFTLAGTAFCAVNQSRQQ